MDVSGSAVTHVTVVNSPVATLWKGNSIHDGFSRVDASTLQVTYYLAFLLPLVACARSGLTRV